MDQLAVLANSDMSWFNFLAILKNRRCELNVLGLPDSRRFAGIDQRFGDFVDASTVVVLAVKSITVKNLHFVSALQINPAVATALAFGFGHVRHPKFDMQMDWL